MYDIRRSLCEQMLFHCAFSERTSEMTSGELKHHLLVFFSQEEIDNAINNVTVLWGDKKYIPKIGDSVVARRKVSSDIYKNTIIGPVINVVDNTCHIVTNPGTDLESDFTLSFCDWNFQYLHPSITDEADNK
jgi:hypothetical protein